MIPFWVPHIIYRAHFPGLKMATAVEVIMDSAASECQASTSQIKEEVHSEDEETGKPKFSVDRSAISAIAQPDLVCNDHSENSSLWINSCRSWSFSFSWREKQLHKIILQMLERQFCPLWVSSWCNSWELPEILSWILPLHISADLMQISCILVSYST